MKPFQTFYFTGYTFDAKTLKASFSYSFDHETDFTETIDFACPEFKVISPIDPEIIHTLLFHLSLAIGISYYKLYPTKDLVIETGSLDENQQKFWKNFYTQGLGEFFYTNKLSPKEFINFVNGDKEVPHTFFSSNSNIPMIALGGGKDSLVSIEAIKKLHIPFYTSTFGKDYYLHKVVGDAIGAPRLLMKREMDPKLFEMNKQGYYNGHVPISGVIAFVLVTAAYLYNYRYIIMSNEKSANEGNTFLDGIEINHQRSKSYEFESDFNKYIGKYLSPNLEYFSLLRGMYEIKIAKVFSQYSQYFGSFSSCNNNFKIIENNKTTEHRRCGVCPKCAFVYTTLRPFLNDEEVQKIFSQELYENKELTPLYKELLGIDGIKPFECIGTHEEVAYAMYLYYEKIKNNSQISPIMELFKDKILPTLSVNDLLMIEKKLFTTYTDETNIPTKFQTILST
ncbi:MAG: hypothetical protein WC010_02070 [Candidatus Absconditabacterales bacterium]